MSKLNSPLCTKCGAELAFATDGFCSACLLERGLGEFGNVAERVGTQMGRYKLVQQIGAGGMGTVWMAEQTEPVRRIVALKAIKPGMDSKQILARFEAERQALALMDHPNIAKVLDADSTPEGRPYFIMEWVDGIPLTKFCDEGRLSIRERLDLFMSVCNAIQHAHQKGIIHRDIKPSNVLVALYDGRPVAKVIDFGIAKATGPRLTEHTLLTELNTLIGTLEYMSPEQADLNQHEIDIRSDIYSLGVLLYELITGSTPITREAMGRTAFDEILRRVREEEVPKPSTRLSANKNSLASVSAQRKMDPLQLKEHVRGDLDCILMKALEKDRARRYDTASGLAQDLRRHLNSEPVIARPPSAAYRAQKWIRRHRNASRIVAAGTGCLVAVSVLGFVAIRQNQNRLASLKAKADAWDYQRPTLDSAARIAQARRADDTGVVGQSGSGTTVNRDPLGLAGEKARIHLQAKQFEEAAKFSREYLDIKRKAGLTNRASLAWGLSVLSQALQGAGKFAEAEPVLGEYLVFLEQIDDIWHTSNVRVRLGTVLLAQKKFQEAEVQLLRAYEGMMMADRSKQTDIHVAYENRAEELIVQLYTDWGKVDEAAKWRTKFTGPAPNPVNLRP